MSTNPVVEYSRSKFEYAAAKRMLKEKYQAKMIFAHDGGMWRAGPELQTLLANCPDPTAVILDLYENPVRINTNELLTMSQQRWQEQMNAWLIEYEQQR